MSTLIENVAKVEAANAAIGEAIGSHGVTVPTGSKLSDKSALIGRIPRPGPAGWGRPANWPRIDLIPMKGLDHDVCYFIIRKPEDTVNFGFSMLANVTGGTWKVERVTVSDDGTEVSPVEGGTTSMGSGQTYVFPFPDEDPIGTVYAIRAMPVGVNHFNGLTRGLAPSASFSKDATFYNSGVILEAIMRGKILPCYSGSYVYAGPRHVAMYSCNISGYIVRNNSTLELLEFRDGTSVTLSNQSLRFSNPGIVVEYDDDTTFLMSGDATELQETVRGDADGKCSYLPLFKKASDPGTPFDWGSSTMSVGNYCADARRMRSIVIPVGFGQNAETVGSCFRNCHELYELDLSGGFGRNATSITNLFYACTNLTTLRLADGFGEKSTTNTTLFYGCFSLRNIIGTPRFKASIMFDQCRSLTHDSLMNIINGLQTVTTAQKLTLGTTNLARLTDEEKKVATDKGWTLA